LSTIRKRDGVSIGGFFAFIIRKMYTLKVSWWSHE